MAVSENSEQEEGEIAESPAGPGLGFSSENVAKATEEAGSVGPGASLSAPPPISQTVALRVPTHGKGRFFWALRKGAASEDLHYPPVTDPALLYSHPNIAWARACLAEEESKSEYSTASEGSAWSIDVSPIREDWTEDLSPSKRIRTETTSPVRRDQSPLQAFSHSQSEEKSEESNRQQTRLPAEGAVDDGEKEDGELEEGEIANDNLDEDVDPVGKQESAPSTAPAVFLSGTAKQDVVSESHERGSIKSRLGAPRRGSRSPRWSNRSRSPRRRELSRSPQHGHERRYRTRSRSREGDRRRGGRSRSRERRDRRGHSPRRGGESRQHGRSSRERSPSRGRDRQERRADSVGSVEAVVKEFWDRVGKLKQEDGDRRSPRSEKGSPKGRGSGAEQARLLREAEALAGEVSVQQAMKSLASVCQTLEDAVWHLCKAIATRGGAPSEVVSKAADDIFFGIRTAYIIGTTGAGRNQGKDAAVLSLIKLAHKDMNRLFTPKQFKEIESWLEHLTSKVNKSPPSGAAGKSNDLAVALTPQETPAMTTSQAPASAPSLAGKANPASSSASEPSPLEPSVELTPSVRDLVNKADSKDLDALRRKAQAYAQGKLRGASQPPEAEEVPDTRASASLPVDPVEPPGFTQPSAPPGFHINNSTASQGAPQPHVHPRSAQAGLSLELIEEAFSDDESQPVAVSAAAPSRGLDLPPGFRLFGQPISGLQAAPLGPPWGSEAATTQMAPSLPKLQNKLMNLPAGGQLFGTKSSPLDDDDDDLPEEILEPPGFAPPSLPATAVGVSQSSIGIARALQAVAASNMGLPSERPSTAASGNRRGLEGQDEVRTQEKPPGFDGAVGKEEGLKLDAVIASSYLELKGTEKMAVGQTKEGAPAKQSNDGAAPLGKRPRSSSEDPEESQRSAKRTSGEGKAEKEQRKSPAAAAIRSEVQKKLDGELLRRLRAVRETQSQGGEANGETVRKDGPSGPGKRSRGQSGKGVTSGEPALTKKTLSRGAVNVSETSNHATEQEARRQSREQDSRGKKEDEKEGLLDPRGGGKGAAERREAAGKGGKKGDARGGVKGKDTDGERGVGRREPDRDERRSPRGHERRGPADRERRREGEARREPLESPKTRSGQGKISSPRGAPSPGARYDSRRGESRSEQRRREDTRRDDGKREGSRRGSDGRRDDREGRSSPRDGPAKSKGTKGDESKGRGRQEDGLGGAKDEGRPKSGSQEARRKPEGGRSPAAVESRSIAEQVTGLRKEQTVGPAVSKASPSVDSADFGKKPSPPSANVVQKRDGEAQPPAQPAVSATSNGAPLNGPTDASVLPAIAAVSLKPSLEERTAFRAPSPAGSRSQSPVPTRAASPGLSDSRVVTGRKPTSQGGRTEPSNLGRPPRAPPRENAQPLRETKNGERGSRAGESVQESGQSRNSLQALSTADSVESAMPGVLSSGAESEGEKLRDGLERQRSGQLAASKTAPARPSEKAEPESNADLGSRGPVSNGVGKLKGILKKSGATARVPSDGLPAENQSGISGDPHVDALLSGLSEKERAAVELERRRRLGEQERMLAVKKLCLVLDLDHTLLNSATFADLASAGPGWAKKLEAKLAGEDAVCRASSARHRELHLFPDMQLWTKLRPGVAAFLKNASALFELHVYTMGNSVYATRMAQILDPTGEYFAGRIISKGDTLEDPPSAPGDSPAPLPSKDLDGVLGMESCVLIIDDNVKVWPHHFHNLIVVERYMYFPGSRQQFGQKGPALFELGHDERAHDGMLASASRVMEQVHGDFFRALQAHNDAALVDARDILQKIQKSILHGVRIVFSRVFPQGTAHPQQNGKWRMAEQFGATCALTLDDAVTHVVAVALGTDKVHWALKNNRHVVNPHWLEASAILYKRANESDFPVLPNMQQG